MSAEQQVLQRFMQSLTRTRKTGEYALDEAVDYASNGRYTTWQTLVDSFADDIKEHGGNNYYYNSSDYYAWHDRDPKTTSFLKGYLGIILDNADTGAITGSDAGGKKVKDKESIVPENTAAILRYPPAEYTTINGLTIHWPDMDAYGMTDAKRNIIKGLYTWWVRGALDLVKETYGISFNDKNADSAIPMEIGFYYEASSTLANASSKELNINLYYFDDLGNPKTNPNGKVDNKTYLDRTLAHEFTHAVMCANINSDLWEILGDCCPTVSEGLAEITQGCDDTRAINYYAQANRADDIRRELSYDSSSTYYSPNDYNYAGGYMLFRYLAHQSVYGRPLPTGTYYTADKTTVKATTAFSGSIDLQKAHTKTINIDARSSKQSTYLYGNKKNNTIYASQGGSVIYGESGTNRLYAGTGKDTFWYSAGSGHNDTIYGFQAGKDSLYLFSDFSSIKNINKDIVLNFRYGGTLRINGILNKAITVKHYKSNTSAASTDTMLFGRQDIANSFNYVRGYYYYGAQGKANTLRITTAQANVSLTDTARYRDILTLDARTATGTVTLKGGSKASTLFGSKYKDTLTGGKGNTRLQGGLGDDTLIGGTGIDTFWYANGDGNDTLRNYQAGRDIIHYANASFSKWSTTGNDLILTVGKGSQKLIGMANHLVSITNAKNIRQNYWFGRKDADNNMTYSAGTIYFGGTRKNTLNVANAASITLNDKNHFKNISVINGRASKGKLTLTGSDEIYATLYGGNGDDTLRAGKKGALLSGESGNDSLYGGAGKDIFLVSPAKGGDTIYNYTSKQDVIRLASGNITSWEIENNNVILKSGQSTTTIVGAKGKVITLQDAKGKVISSRAYTSSSLPLGAKYANNAKTNILLAKNYHGLLTLRHFAGTVNRIDAKATNQAVNLDARGHKRGINFYAGSSTTTMRGSIYNDTFYFGKGTDTYEFEKDGGSDTIHGYKAGRDVIKLRNGAITSATATATGDVILQNGKSRLTLKGAAAKELLIKDANNKLARRKVFSTSLPQNTSLNAAKTSILLGAEFKGKFDLQYYGPKITTIDGRKAASPVELVGHSSTKTIYGGNNADTLRAGTAGSTMDGGKGNDKLYGNTGKDTFLYRQGNGTDTIFNYEEGKDRIQYANGKFSELAYDKNDAVLKTSGGSVRVSGGKNKFIRIAQKGAGEIGYKRTGSGYTLRGSKANDVYYATSKSNTFLYEGGKDTIYGIKDGQDTIQLTGPYASYSYYISGQDVILDTDLGSITLKDALAKTVTIKAGSTSIKERFPAPVPQGVAMWREDGQVYINTKGKVDYLAAGEHLKDTNQYVTIYGSSYKDETLKLADGGGVIYGNGGNDTYYGGKGADTFNLYSSYYGAYNTTIYNYDPDQDSIYFGGFPFHDAVAHGNDVVISYYDSNSTVTIKDGVGKTIHVQDRNEDYYYGPSDYGTAYSSSFMTKGSKKSLGYLAQVQAISPAATKQSIMRPRLGTKSQATLSGALTLSNTTTTLSKKIK